MYKGSPGLINIVKQIQNKYKSLQIVRRRTGVLQIDSRRTKVNPIPAEGGGEFDPPPVVFLHNSKSIGLRLLKFSDFSYIPKALSLGLKPGLFTA